MTTSQQLTPKGEYTGGIEGPAVDRDGILYVVSLKENGPPDKGTRSIGMVEPGTAKSKLFAKLPVGSLGSGTRFDRDGRMYVADHKGHNVFVFERGQTKPGVYFHSEAFNQPNDLAIAADGTLYASDPRIKKGQASKIWRISRRPDGTGRGEVMANDHEPMGHVNGIDLSPDGATLYVSESDTKRIVAYQLQGSKLAERHVVSKFDSPSGIDLDGLRTDSAGKIFVAWNGNGKVLAVAPDGSSVEEIRTQGKNPSNLTFGGPDAMTVYVTQVDGGFIESFRHDKPGREPFQQP